MDIFEETVATYCNPEGAKAFMAKEMKFVDQRSRNIYGLLPETPLKGLRILDVGCGFGRDVAYFRSLGAEAYGCDMSQALLREAPEHIHPFLAVDDIRSDSPLPFGGRFDIVWCISVFVHVPRTEMPRVFARLWDALTPGGILIFSTKLGYGERIVTNLGEKLPRVMVYYQVDAIRQVVETLGGQIEFLSDDGILPAGDPRFELRARKPQ